MDQRDIMIKAKQTRTATASAMDGSSITKED